MPTFGGEISGRAAGTARTLAESGAGYGRQYYDGYGDADHKGYRWEVWGDFFTNMADQIVTRLRPRRALDVGCAKGFLVGCLRDRGVDAYGIDASEYAIGEVRPDIKPFCWVASATDPIKENYDLITCHEVCEHLLEPEATEAIRQMTSHCDTILFSSTPGHFEDPTHLNVRPIVDWLRLFAQSSFAPDEGFDASFVTPWAVLFRRTATPPVDERLRRFAHVRTRAFTAWELNNSPEVQDELHRILNSKGWRLLNVYRNARARVKEPIARAIRHAQGATTPAGRIRWRVMGKRALEIGGPSPIFNDGGLLPVYSVLRTVDNCLFSARTIWTGDVQVGNGGFRYHSGKAPGAQLICDATDLKTVRDGSYQVVLASHCLEHIANPLRALEDWKRVLGTNGCLLLVLPHKDGTFDWRRPVTPLEHMIRDYEMKTAEDDLSHLPEILALHDLERDPPAGAPAQFKARCLANSANRSIHHHVFDTRTAVRLIDHAGFQLSVVATFEPFHIVILAKKTARQPDNSRFLLPDAKFLVRSQFPSDRTPQGSR